MTLALLHNSEGIQRELDRLGNLTNDQLRVELTKALGLTVEHLVRLAAIIRLLEERGTDLTDLRLGLMGYLRRIAYGQVLPEIVVRFQGFPSLLRRISSLPIPDQERLLLDEPLVVCSEDRDHRLIQPLMLSIAESRQVFAPDHIRDEAEQLVWLRRARVPQQQSLPAGITIDRRRRRAIVTDGVVLTLADLTELMARLTRKS